MMNHLRAAAAVMLVACAVGTQAQTAAPAKTTAKKVAKKKVETPTERSLRELREQMQTQQQQIDSLKQQLADRDAKLASTTQAAQDASTSAANANQQAQSALAAIQANRTELETVSSSVNDLKIANTGVAQTISDTKRDLTASIESPTVIHYKGLRITPVAFFAFEGVWRQHSVNSDINTPFNSIPFPSASQGHVSELNFSGRQSRLGGLFEHAAGPFTLSGYFESDFLGTGTSSNNNQSNSYVLRQRQIWGKLATKGGLIVTGGQMWSLVTENRRSIDTRTEIQPQTIDPQYTVGYNWTRQPAIRVAQRFGTPTNGFTGALAVEQAQITGFTANGTNPNQYFFGGLGQNGGLYNAAVSADGATTSTCTTPTGTVACVTAINATDITTYANNSAPDIIVKAAYDNPAFHLEIGGLARFLRNEYFPVTWGGTASAPTFTYDNTHGLRSNTATAGGVFGAGRVYLKKYAELGIQGMAGTGVGRYGSSQLADATLRPNQTLEPIRNYHGMASIEIHATPKLELFAYYGGEYAQRTVYTSPVGSLIGYGPRNLNNSGCYNLSAGPSAAVGNAGAGGGLGATNCGSPTRYIQEPVAGFAYRAYSSPQYGRLQYSVTYSYIQRNIWSGNNIPSSGPVTTPSGPRATEPMVHVQMRYYIP